MSTQGKILKKSPPLFNEKALDPTVFSPSLKFRKTSELQRRIDLYFQVYTSDTGLYPSFEGLARHIGFLSENDMIEWAQKTRDRYVPPIKRAWAKVTELVTNGCLRGNIGCMAYLKFKSGSPLVGGSIYNEKMTLEIDSPPALSPQEQDRLRKVAELWERERRRESAGKVLEIKKTSL